MLDLLGFVRSGHWEGIVLTALFCIQFLLLVVTHATVCFSFDTFMLFGKCFCFLAKFDTGTWKDSYGLNSAILLTFRANRRLCRFALVHEQISYSVVEDQYCSHWRCRNRHFSVYSKVVEDFVRNQVFLHSVRACLFQSDVMNAFDVLGVLYHKDSSDRLRLHRDHSSLHQEDMPIKTVDEPRSRQNNHFKLVNDNKPYQSYIATHFDK